LQQILYNIWKGGKGIKMLVHYSESLLLNYLLI